MLSDFEGGSEQFICRLMKRLNRKKFEPRALVSRKGKAHALAASFGIPVHVQDYGKGVAALASFLHKERIDLAQSGYFGVDLAMAARTAGIPHVWRLGGHIDIVDSFCSLGNKKHLLGLISCLADRVVCPTEFLKSQFQGIGARNLSVIHNGVDPRQLRALGARATPKAFTPGKSFSVAMVADITPQKRHIDLIRAAALVRKQCPGTRFYFLGGACEKFAPLVKSLRAEIDRLGLSDAIQIHRYGEERFAVLKRMDLLVLPSLKEGSSNALLEASALGIPVVATKSGGNPELIREGRTGILIPPRDPKRLAEAIVSLLESGRRRNRMRAESKKWIDGNFSLRACVSQYETIYEEL